METWICIDEESSTCGLGKTPTEAFEYVKQTFDAILENCIFYSVNEPVKMKPVITPVISIIPSNRSTK